LAEKYTRFDIVINDIELKMMRKGNHCWIKAIPISRISMPSSLHFILNGEEHHFDIYDSSGREAHEVYFEADKCTPSFYLKSVENSFRIDFKDREIKKIPIKKTHKFDTYIRDNCSCKSSDASCWAAAVYYTKRHDKSPFDEM